MQDKKRFGEYIAEKRKKMNLTQEELAHKLYVIPTTISKWERGITYPDISMITCLCKELNISEHEFFTACDDETLNKEKREIKKYRTFKKWLFILLNLSYLIGIVVCFICNLVLEKELSWFFIVLIGIFISFSITSVPFYLKNNKFRLIKISFIVTGLVYLLLFTIHYVNKGHWLLGSFIIATFVFIFLWATILIGTFTKLAHSYKISIGLILFAVVTVVINPFCAKVLNIVNDESSIPNVFCAVFMIVLAFILTLRQFFSKKD